MSKITSIIKQKKIKNRYNIYLDDEYYCSLNIEQIAANNLKEDLEICESSLKEIIDIDNTKFGFDLAIKYISYKRRTIKETKDYLATKGLEREIIEKSVAKVISYGYLNDSDYAKEFISFQTNQSKYGKKYIINKLKQRGISDDIIEESIQTYDYDTELKICWKVFSKVYNRNKHKPKQKAKASIYSSLASKGFSFDIIENVIKTTDFDSE